MWIRIFTGPNKKRSDVFLPVFLTTRSRKGLKLRLGLSPTPACTQARFFHPVASRGCKIQVLNCCLVLRTSFVSSVIHCHDFIPVIRPMPKRRFMPIAPRHFQKVLALSKCALPEVTREEPSAQLVFLLRDVIELTLYRPQIKSSAATRSEYLLLAHENAACAPPHRYWISCMN